MTTDDEVLRLFERADPALTDDTTPARDAAGYLDALRTRSSTVDYLDAEPTLPNPPTNRPRWLAAAAAAATVAVIVGGLVLAARGDDVTGVPSDTGPMTEPPSDTGPLTEQPAVTEGPETTPPPPPADELRPVEDTGARVGFIGLPPEGVNPTTPQDGEIIVQVRSCHEPTGRAHRARQIAAARRAHRPRRRTADLAEVRGSPRGCELAVDGSPRTASHTRGRRTHAVRSGHRGAARAKSSTLRARRLLRRSRRRDVRFRSGRRAGTAR